MAPEGQICQSRRSKKKDVRRWGWSAGCFQMLWEFAFEKQLHMYLLTNSFSFILTV